jgi:beta-N-acetylhexosaminidase
MVEAQIEGYAEAGVLSCAKHFPGHGDTHLDSHLALPSVDISLEELEEREMVPFRAAIKAGAPTLMTAHILFPQVDPSGIPATLSPVILTDLLRGKARLHRSRRHGLSADEGGSGSLGTPRAAVMAAKAGADMLLVCHSWEEQEGTYNALMGAVESGELPLSRVNEAVSRVLAAKRLAFSQEAPSLSVIGSAEHRQVADTITEASGRTLVNGPTTLGESAPE